MLIKCVAGKYNISADTLRYYDRIALLSPHRENGRRRYSTEDLHRLAVIIEMKALKFSLAEIKAILDADEKVDRNLEHAMGDPSAVRELLILINGKLKELENLEENIRAVKGKLCRYAAKIERELAGITGNHG